MYYILYFFLDKLALRVSGAMSGIGGLVVSMLASGTQDRGFKPGRTRRIFSGVKILSMPSFGREVKQCVPCHRSAARKRTLLDYVEVESLRPNYSDVSRSKFPPSLRRAPAIEYVRGRSLKCPYTRAAWAPTGDERRQPKRRGAQWACIRPECLRANPARPHTNLPSTIYLSFVIYRLCKRDPVWHILNVMTGDFSKLLVAYGLIMAI
jgi:hypothetical protein